MFGKNKYDPSIYEEIEKNYKAGHSYKLINWEWGYDKDKDPKSFQKELFSVECNTIDKFNEELWDLFANFADKNTVGLIWGAPNDLKQQNPYKEFNPYCDGLIYALVGQEFREASIYENRNVSRFVSILSHWGYNYTIELIEKN